MRKLIPILFVLISVNLFSQSYSLFSLPESSKLLYVADTTSTSTTFSPATGRFTYTADASMMAPYLAKYVKLMRKNFNSEELTEQRHEVFEFLDRKYAYFLEKSTSVEEGELAELMAQEENKLFVDEYFYRTYKLLHQVINPFVKSLKTLESHKLYYTTKKTIYTVGCEQETVEWEQLQDELSVVESVNAWILNHSTMYRTWQYLQACDNQHEWIENLTGEEQYAGEDLESLDEFRKVTQFWGKHIVSN